MCEKCQDSEFFRDFNVAQSYPVALCRKCYETLEIVLQATPEFKEFEKADQIIRAMKLARSRSVESFLAAIKEFDAAQMKIWHLTKKFLDG